MMLSEWELFKEPIYACHYREEHPDDLYARLKQSAGANHRSINSEIIVCMERAFHSQRVFSRSNPRARATVAREDAQCA